MAEKVEAVSLDAAYKMAFLADLCTYLCKDLLPRERGKGAQIIG
jgi:hypothetical protein